MSSTETILQGLFPGTSYEIFVNAETIEKGPSSESIHVMLPYDGIVLPFLCGVLFTLGTLHAIFNT